MSDGAASTGAKGVRYAEEVLSVHTVHRDALKAQEDLSETLTVLLDKRVHRRNIESWITDREMEIAADERGKHPEMAISAMERHLKIKFHNDSDLKKLRSRLAEVIDQVDEMEFNKTLHESAIRIAAARLQELGGYLQYLAVIKQAGETEKQAKRIEAQRERDPWSS